MILMKNYEFIQKFKIACGYLGLGFSCLLLLACIASAGVKANSFFAQFGPMGNTAAVLSALPSFPSLDSDSQRKQDLQTLSTALKAYYAKHGTYVVAGSGAGGFGNGVVSADGLPTYKTIVQGLVADGDLSATTTIPSIASDYYLLYVCGQSYAFSAKLDNPSAADITNIQASCNGTGGNGTYTIYNRNYAVTQNSPSWPLIFGQSGSYHVSSTSDLADMDALGMHLMIYLPGPVQLTDLPTYHAKYITTNLADMVVNTVCPSGVCDMAPAKINSVLAQAKTYLATVSNDPNLLGYWVLDDYPGADIHTLLEQIHALVVEANKTSVVQRPTICGLSAPVGLLGAQSTADYGQTIKNVTPAGCDMIDIYSYGIIRDGATDASQFDWSMGSNIQNIFRQLQSAGWNVQKIQLMGSPQAFGQPGLYVTPTRENIATESAAFCNAGASAVEVFSWNTSSVGPTGGLTGAQEPFNNTGMRQGVIDGVQRCKTIWNARLIGTTTSILSSTVNTDTQRKQDLDTLSNAVKAYYAKHGTYQIAQAGTNAGGQGIVSADGLPLNKTIIQALYADNDLSSSTNLPVNPANISDYYILKICNAGQSFALSAKLDNSTAFDIANIQASCSGVGPDSSYGVLGRNYAVGVSKNTDTIRKQDLQALSSALNAYYTKHGTFLVTGAGAGGMGQGIVSADGLPQYKTIIQGLFADGDLASSSTLPAYPITVSDFYMMYICSGGQSYTLSAKLANPSAADIANTQTSCNGTGPNGTYTLYQRNYSVTSGPPVSSDSKRKQDLQTLSTALKAYYAKHGTYVVAGSGGGGNGGGVVSQDGPPTYKTIAQGLVADGDLSATTTIPSIASDYYLLYVCGQSYAFSAKLDNPSAADVTNIQASCNGSGPNGTYTIYNRNYAVTN